MEERDKYYTPKIEEFHVGFEYEIIYDDKIKVTVFDESDMMNVLRPATTSTLGGIRWKLINNRIRVKYLDKEDIESLGFELIPGGCIDTITKLGYTCYSIDQKGTNNSVGLYYNFEHKHLIIITTIDYNDIYLFRGTIKNKSELKFILKSIGVLEENKI